MKFVFPRLTFAFAAFVCTAAAEPVNQDNQAPKPVADPASQAKPGAREAVAFLGVITGPVPRIMSEQLGIPAGEGLVVLAVAPDAPAAKAGVAANDVIKGIDGTGLRSTADLTNNLKKHSPGDVVRLSLVRKGEPAEIRVTLGARVRNPKQDQELEAIVRKLMEGRANNDEQLKDIGRLVAKAQPAREGDAIELPTGASIRVVDENGCVELKTTDNRKEVVVKDQNDKIVWSGPWNTEEDKKAAPPDVSKRFKDLDIETLFESSRIRLTLPGGKPQGK